MELNLISPCNTLGYGYTGLNILKGLSPDVSYFPIGRPDVTTQEDFDIVSAAIENAKLFDHKAPCIRIWHQHDMSQFVGSGMKIGFPIFELDKFDHFERHHLETVDRLFVCSQWAKDVVLDQTYLKEDQVRVVPLGVDTELFKPAPPNSYKTTVFFNCGKWEVRKGHDILAQAFNAAFDESDNVELWMMCDNPFLKEEQTKSWQKLFLDSKLGHKIRLIPRVQTHKEVYNIMSRTDCGVFPARAEGWNLELLEMMACGKQVITTNYSAHTEFCNASNARMIDINSFEKAFDGVWFNGEKGNWASFNEESYHQLLSHLKAVHEDKQSGKDITNNNGITTAQAFTWDNTTREVLTHVQ